MLRSTIRDKKPDIPHITGKYIGDLLATYHAQKTHEAFSRFEMPISPTMRNLEAYYNDVLQKKPDLLTPKQVFEVCQILFSNNKRDGEKTKQLVGTLLISLFDPRVSAALDSAAQRVGNIDVLVDHFEVICKNPTIAASIVYSVLTLNHFIHHRLVVEADKRQLLYSKELFDEMKTESQIGIDVLDIQRIINNPESGLTPPMISKFKTLPSLLGRDALLYIAVKLYEASEFEYERFKKLNACTSDQLVEIAKMVHECSDPKQIVDSYIAAKTNSTQQVESQPTKPITLEEKRAESHVYPVIPPTQLRR